VPMDLDVWLGFPGDRVCEDWDDIADPSPPPTCLHCQGTGLLVWEDREVFCGCEKGSEKWLREVPSIELS
jgi:hypothetical protein